MHIDELEASADYDRLQSRFAELAAELETMSVDDGDYRDLYQTKLQVLVENTRATNSTH